MPVVIGDPVICLQVTDSLIDRFGIYVQPINYPTVPKGTERLRLTPAPHHSDTEMDKLCGALSVVWQESSIWLEQRQAAE